MLVRSKKTGVEYDATKNNEGKWELTQGNLLIKTISHKSFKRTYEEVTGVAGNMEYLSNSKLSNYMQCPRQFYKCYANKEDTVFTKQGSALHATLEDYYAPNNTEDINTIFERRWAELGADEFENYEEWKELLPKYVAKEAEINPNPNIIARELEFNIKIGEVPIKGYIDRIDRIDDNTILIIDYKSNMMPYSDKEVKGSTQFKLYSMAVRDQSIKDIIGDFTTVLCCYSMLRTNQRQYVSFNMGDLATFAGWLQYTWDNMVSGVNKDVARTNQYCSYCPCRQDCKKYQSLISGDLVMIPSNDLGTLMAVNDEYEKIKVAEKAIKNRKAELEAIIKAGIAENNGRLVAGNTEWTLKTSATRSYPLYKLIEKFGDDEEIKAALDEEAKKASISATTLKKIKPLKGKDVSDIEVVQYKSPTLVAKEFKPE